MAANILAVGASGNFSAAATWRLVDPTSFLESITNTSGSTTSFVSSSAFTPGAITIDGIGLYISTRTGSPSGTFSVQLAIAGVLVTGTLVTTNASDFDAPPTTAGLGWYFFKFAAPVTLLAATAYTVQIKTSVNTTVTLYRDATTGNWSRFLRTTTTQAPAAGDQTFIQGAWTAAGAQTAYAVTMDLDGSGTTNLGNIEISKGGTLQYGVTASTTYWLQMQGNITQWPSSIFTMGTVGTPMPITSIGWLIFNNTVNVQWGLTISSNANFQACGVTLSNDRALLTADAGVGTTTLTTNVSTGWKSGDTIAIASTSRVNTESEELVLSGDATGTSIPIAATSFAHSGTSPTQAEVIYTRRNVRIVGVTGSLQGYINILNSSTVDMRWMEVSRMGSATTLKRGIDVGTTTGSFTMMNCCLRSFTVVNSIGLNLGQSANNNITISDTFFFSMASSCISTNAVATTGLAISITNCIAMLNASAGLYTINNCKITFTGNKAISATTVGFTLTDTTYDGTGTINNLTAHSNLTVGIQFSSLIPTVKMAGGLSTFTSWRNGTFGMATAATYSMVIDTATLFGNGTANFTSNGATHSCLFKSITMNAGVTTTCPVGLAISSASPITDSYFDNCNFGVTQTHATGDISFLTSTFADVAFRNCNFNSTTTVANQGNMVWNSQIKILRLNTTAGNHKTFKKFGTLLPDSTIFNVSTPSTRLTPNSATQKLESSGIKLTVQSGQTAMVTVYLRKSVVGDGTAYNGNQPRLIVKANPALGYAADVVLLTADNSCNGAFVLYSGTIAAPTDNAVVEIVTDCDGTTGWLNVDDVKVVTATANDQGSQKYWDNGVPSQNLASKTSGALIAGGVIL